MAEQTARLAWLRDRELVGINADMVAKWERGAKGISARYRELLCTVLGVQSLTTANGALPMVSDRLAVGDPQDALTADLADTAALLEELGAAGTVLQSKMFDAWKDEMMRRRAFLKLVSLVPPAGLTDRRQSHPVAVSRTAEPLTDLEDLAGRYQVLYHSVAPTVLLTPVVAHLNTVSELLRDACGSNVRRKLFANRAHVAILAGRLAFFDLQDPMSARGYYNLALEAAREAFDHRQAAAALGHMAFVPAADHGFTAAGDYLRGANQQLTRCPHGQLSSWLAAVESELHTNAGLHPAALAALDRGHEALAEPGLCEELPWFDYYDDARLAGFAGYSNLRAGRFHKAREALTDALGHLPHTAVKQRAVFLTDLAATHLGDGNLDEACRAAGEAADQLHGAGYATGFARLREFRATVEPWRSSRAVRALDDQLATIA